MGKPPKKKQPPSISPEELFKKITEREDFLEEKGWEITQVVLDEQTGEIKETKIERSAPWWKSAWGALTAILIVAGSIATIIEAC